MPSHWLLVLGMGAKIEQDYTNNGVKRGGSCGNPGLKGLLATESCPGGWVESPLSGWDALAAQVLHVKGLGRRSDSMKNN